MKTFKEHILEKLKVTPSQTIILTNREFFKLLKEYTNDMNTVSLITDDVFGHDVDDLPKFYKNETRYIASIQPYTGGHDQILLELKDIYDRKQIVLCNGDKIEDGKIKLQEKGIFNIEVVCK